MTCPICQASMTHQGYFAWRCGVCGHRSEGELPRGVLALRHHARASTG